MRNRNETKYLKAFGKRMAEVRRSNDMTQEELAAEADVSALTVGYIEQGRQWPRIYTMQRLAKALDVKVEDFFKGL